MSDQRLENTYGASKLKNFLEFSFVLIRSMWQRAGAVRLFVEHVTLLNECDDDEVNSESVVTLWKVFPIQVTQLSIKNNKQMKQPDCICVIVCHIFKNVVSLATKAALHKALNSPYYFTMYNSFL